MNNAPQNYHCPPLMSDGRHATDYRPNCDKHMLLNQQQQFTHSNQQRLFLQRNAAQLRSQNQQEFMSRANCCSCNTFHVDPNMHNLYWAQYRQNIKK